jgi:hypothetical protein
MKRKNQDPRTYSRQHCQERARERYDHFLTDNEYHSLEERIRQHLMGNKAYALGMKHINTEGSQVTLVAEHWGRTWIAVFDQETQILKTLLPPEQFSEHLS